MKCFLSPRRDTRPLALCSPGFDIKLSTLLLSTRMCVPPIILARLLIPITFFLLRIFLFVPFVRTSIVQKEYTQGMIFVYSSNDVDKFYLFETRSSVETEARFIFDKECHLAHGREEYPAACCRLPTYLSTYLPLTIGEICSPKAPHLSSWDHLR